MMDDIDNHGFGLPHLGIKPTAIGVAPVMPLNQQQLMGAQMPGGMQGSMMRNMLPMQHMPSISEMRAIPQQYKPMTPLANKAPNQVATALPLSRPEVPFISEPLKTTESPMTTADLAGAQVGNKMNLPISQYISAPMSTPFDKNPPATPVQGLPGSLQPQQMPFPQPNPKFNQLSDLLNKGQMK